MSGLTVRVYPGDQKVIAMTIYLGRELYGQGGTVGDALIDLGNEFKGIANEVRNHRQYIPNSNHSGTVSEDTNQ